MFEVGGLDHGAVDLALDNRVLDIVGGSPLQHGLLNLGILDLFEDRLQHQVVFGLNSAGPRKVGVCNSTG